MSCQMFGASRGARRPSQLDPELALGPQQKQASLLSLAQNKSLCGSSRRTSLDTRQEDELLGDRRLASALAREGASDFLPRIA